MHALCTCYACAPARTMRYARAPHVPCTYNVMCTRCARAMLVLPHVLLHVPSDMRVLRRCYALTMKYSSMHALCTCNACAPARTMRYERVLRTRYALTMQQSRAVHVPCICSCTYHAISTCSARAMHLQCNMHALCTCYAHAMHVHLHVPSDMQVLRTCYALTMQYSCAKHVLYLCPCTYPAAFA